MKIAKVYYNDDSYRFGIICKMEDNSVGGGISRQYWLKPISASKVKKIDKYLLHTNVTWGQ